MSLLNLFRTRELKAPSNKFLKQCAFTLAEVLITLGIIGIVAAMTIPNLVKEYQKTQTEVQLKKAYSILTQFFKQYMADEGCNDLMCTGLFDPAKKYNVPDTDWHDIAETVVKKYIKVLKVCKNGDDSCHETTKRIKGTITQSSFAGVTEPTFITSDGIKFTIANAGCSQTTFPDSSKLKNICSWVLVDLNGDKAPNTFGIDVFGFGNVAQDGMIYPDTSIEWTKATVGNSWETYSNYWRNNAGGGQCGEVGKTIAQSAAINITGQNCLARIIENNWKIDY